ncbi:hypothetical protein [Paraburkholderia sp. MM6662-R1]|uniref:hypothetical protein n=1 Tax=Paraburkholderia sp. MM6662-R1 TaxID=2991066 RepID=UPI003D1A3900
MDTHLMIGLAVMFGLIGVAASRDLLRRMREQQPRRSCRSRSSHRMRRGASGERRRVDLMQEAR